MGLREIEFHLYEHIHRENSISPERRSSTSELLTGIDHRRVG